MHVVRKDTAECIMFSPFLRASAVMQGMNMVDPPSCAGGVLNVEIRHWCKLTSHCFKRDKISE
jgi:hypothetical protein